MSTLQNNNPNKKKKDIFIDVEKNTVKFCLACGGQIIMLKDTEELICSLCLMPFETKQSSETVGTILDSQMDESFTLALAKDKVLNHGKIFNIKPVREVPEYIDEKVDYIGKVPIHEKITLSNGDVVERTQENFKGNKQTGWKHT